MQPQAFWLGNFQPWARACFGFRARIHVSTVCALCSQETCGDLSHVKLHLEPSLLEHQCPLKWILISNLGSVWTLSWWICKYLLISLTYTGGKSPPEHIWNAGHPRSEDTALLTLWNIPELFLHTENYACWWTNCEKFKSIKNEVQKHNISTHSK